MFSVSGTSGFRFGVWGLALRVLGLRVLGLGVKV